MNIKEYVTESLIKEKTRQLQNAFLQQIDNRLDHLYECIKNFTYIRANCKDKSEIMNDFNSLLDFRHNAVYNFEEIEVERINELVNKYNLEIILPREESNDNKSGKPVIGDNLRENIIRRDMI